MNVQWGRGQVIVEESPLVIFEVCSVWILNHKAANQRVHQVVLLLGKDGVPNPESAEHPVDLDIPTTMFRCGISLLLVSLHAPVCYCYKSQAWIVKCWYFSTHSYNLALFPTSEKWFRNSSSSSETTTSLLLKELVLIEDLSSLFSKFRISNEVGFLFFREHHALPP